MELQYRGMIHQKLVTREIPRLYTGIKANFLGKNYRIKRYDIFAVPRLNLDKSYSLNYG